MITTAAALDALIPAPADPTRSVPAGAEPPYELGDLVAVLFHNFIDDDPTWIPGTVLSCEKPDTARRFVCRVAIGNTGNTPVEIPRVYCWEDGTGEFIARLDEERPAMTLLSLNGKTSPLGRIA